MRPILTMRGARAQTGDFGSAVGSGVLAASRARRGCLAYTIIIDDDRVNPALFPTSQQQVSGSPIEFQRRFSKTTRL